MASQPDKFTIDTSQLDFQTLVTLPYTTGLITNLSKNAAKATLHGIARFFIWIFIHLIIAPIIFRIVIPFHGRVLANKQDLVDKRRRANAAIARLLDPLSLIVARTPSPAQCIQAHTADGTCPSGACEGDILRMTNWSLAREPFNSDLLYDFCISRPRDQLPKLGKYPLFILPDTDSKWSFHDEAVEMPADLLSLKSLLFVGFTRAKATEIWRAWCMRPGRAECTGCSRCWFDFIMGHDIREPSGVVLARRYIAKYQKQILDKYPGLVKLVAFAREELEKLIAGQEHEDNSYSACLERFGLNERVTACILDSDYEQTMKQQSAAHWAEKVVEARYGVLRWASQPAGVNMLEDPKARAKASAEWAGIEKECLRLK